MHRLLKVKHEQFQKIQNLLFHTRHNQNPHIRGHPNPCLVCKQVHVPSESVRLQSTHSVSSFKVKTPRKKRAKSANNYAEILVVGEAAASERKATIRKLNPKDLKIFTTTNFNLSELYKLRSFSGNSCAEEHTYDNLRVFENIPTVIESDLSSFTPPKVQMPVWKPEIDLKDALSEAEAEFDDVLSPKLDVFEPAVVEDDPITDKELKDVKLPKVVSKETRARRENFRRTLAAYIEVCAFSRSPQKGLNAFHFCKRECSKLTYNNHLSTLEDITLYNALLRGFAAKGSFLKVEEVIRYAEEMGVQLNAQSYALIFECLARVNYDNNHTKYLRIYARQAYAQGISFDRVMNESIFADDQRELVLEGIKTVHKDYTPQYRPPDVRYVNKLVNGLNTVEERRKSSAKNATGIFRDVKWENLINEQMKMEENGFVTIKSVEASKEPSEEVLQLRKTFDEHIAMWKEAAYAGFQRDLAALVAHRHSLNLDVYMRCIPTKDFIEIIIDEARKIAQGSESYSPTVNLLNKDLGAKVYARYKILRKQKSGALKKIFDIHKRYCDDYSSNHPKLSVLPENEVTTNPRKSWQLLEHAMREEGASIMLDHHEWVPSVLQNIGKFLYNIIMHDLKIDVNSMRQNSKHKNYLPAFYTLFRQQGKTSKEEVKPHPVLSRLHKASMQTTLSFPAYEIPMLCPPVPWIGTHTGGYLVAPCEMVRLPPLAIAQKQRLREADPRDLYPSFDSLNQLAAVPWMVNKRVFDIILEVFSNGGSHKLDVPQPPSSLPPPPSAPADADKADKYKHFRQKLQHRRKKAEMYSLWCDCLYRLSLTNHFRDRIFWLPHNMDFRGRVYPVPPHLNHLGSDLARATLVFAEARPLGERGLDWLKLHLVNLTGQKKRDSIEERLAYANSVLDEIYDSADNPLTGRQWWTESDEPWQTLACCMEITAAVRSGAPENYPCHFPVHQDGSCNGLQHYAALGRDAQGAFSVNLVPSTVPQDVYSLVAGFVEKQRSADAKRGLEIAKILDGFVKRKVIKQTVMTTVYGVTRFGARLQIARQLKDIDEFPKEHVWAASAYLTGRTFDSLRTMFTSTREIQDWFTECARLISSVGEQNVEWVTPLGLPIVQPYFRYRQAGTGFIGGYQLMDKFEKPNTMKQKNAFPPNFIHSLDSSHMILTSLRCERAGITFVSVHDCYWTHPSTVHIMNKICREQFVALHSEPILENLSVFLTQRYSYNDNEFADDGSVTDMTKKKLNRVLRQLPKTGDFDIREVLNSVFFFS